MKIIPTNLRYKSIDTGHPDEKTPYYSHPSSPAFSQPLFAGVAKGVDVREVQTILTELCLM